MNSAISINDPIGVSIGEYLTRERAATDRHEYINGQIRAMAGEKLPHAIIAHNIGGLLYVQLKGTPCFAVSKDTKVRSGLGVSSERSVSGMFSYPDVVVVCGEPKFFDDRNDIITNPTSIVEVLSPSTELFDRGDKFQGYRNWNPTLKEYLLVSQTRPLVELYRRQPDDSWLLQEAAGLDASVVLPAIGCTLKLADVYERIVFGKEGGEGVD